MEWIRLIDFCLLTAALTMTLQQMHPAFAGLLCAAFGVLIVSAVLPQVREYIGTIREFLDSLGLSGEYYRVMLRAMGIVLVTQIAVQVCRDMDAPSIAQRADLCGRLALLGVAVPVFIELTRLAVEVLR